MTGICGSAIIEVVAEMYLAGVISEDGVIGGELSTRSPRITPNGRTFSYLLHDGRPRIAVTQNDVRAVQLAKAALYAGIRLLMEKQGVATVDCIRLAGAFGSFIDPKYAMVLGLIPDCDLSGVQAVGNAAGTGAMMALLNRDHRREIEQTVRRIGKKQEQAPAKMNPGGPRNARLGPQGAALPCRAGCVPAMAGGQPPDPRDIFMKKKG